MSGDLIKKLKNGLITAGLAGMTVFSGFCLWASHEIYGTQINYREHSVGGREVSVENFDMNGENFCYCAREDGSEYLYLGNDVYALWIYEDGDGRVSGEIDTLVRGRRDLVPDDVTRLHKQLKDKRKQYASNIPFKNVREKIRNDF